MKGCWPYWGPEADLAWINARKSSEFRENHLHVWCDTMVDRERLGKSVETGSGLRVLAALVLILFFSFSPSVAQERPARSGLDDPEIREFIRLLNARRQVSGCPELKWDDRIAAVAQAHSRDMVRRNFFSHENPEGEDPFDRLEKAGIYFWHF